MMRYAGPAARSVASMSVVALVLALLGPPGCGGSDPAPTPEEIKTSRINRLINEPVQKQIDAAAKRKTKGRTKR